MTQAAHMSLLPLEGMAAAAAAPLTLVLLVAVTPQARICAGRELLTIRISDQGGGIAPEHVEKVRGWGGAGSLRS
jgi:hypothetical protein